MEVGRVLIRLDYHYFEIRESVGEQQISRVAIHNHFTAGTSLDLPLRIFDPQSIQQCAQHTSLFRPRADYHLSSPSNVSSVNLSIASFVATAKVSSQENKIPWTQRT